MVLWNRWVTWSHGPHLSSNVNVYSQCSAVVQWQWLKVTESFVSVIYILPSVVLSVPYFITFSAKEAHISFCAFLQPDGNFAMLLFLLGKEQKRDWNNRKELSLIVCSLVTVKVNVGTDESESKRRGHAWLDTCRSSVTVVKWLSSSIMMLRPWSAIMGPLLAACASVGFENPMDAGLSHPYFESRD